MTQSKTVDTVIPRFSFCRVVADGGYVNEAVRVRNGQLAVLLFTTREKAQKCLEDAGHTSDWKVSYTGYADMREWLQDLQARFGRETYAALDVAWGFESLQFVACFSTDDLLKALAAEDDDGTDRTAPAEMLPIWPNQQTPNKS